MRNIGVQPHKSGRGLVPQVAKIVNDNGNAPPDPLGQCRPFILWQKGKPGHHFLLGRAHFNVKLPAMLIVNRRGQHQIMVAHEAPQQQHQIVGGHIRGISKVDSALGIESWGTGESQHFQFCREILSCLCNDHDAARRRSHPPAF